MLPSSRLGLRLINGSSYPSQISMLRRALAWGGSLCSKSTRRQFLTARDILARRANTAPSAEP